VGLGKVMSASTGEYHDRVYLPPDMPGGIGGGGGGGGGGIVVSIFTQDR
jgi:hypothetical protein